MKLYIFHVIFPKRSSSGLVFGASYAEAISKVTEYFRFDEFDSITLKETISSNVDVILVNDMNIINNIVKENKP